MANILEQSLDEIAHNSENRVKIITVKTPKFFPQIQIHLFRKIIKLFELSVRHIVLGLVLKRSDREYIKIVNGFSTEFLFLTYLFSLSSHNIFLLIHHNVQQAVKNPFLNLLLRIYGLMGYNFIINEDSNALYDIGFTEKDIQQYVELPHPVLEIAQTTASRMPKTKKIKVGIIGQIRNGKQFAKNVELLKPLSKKFNFELVIGTDSLLSIDGYKSEGITLIDTTTEEDYLSAIEYCDVIVLNYDESKYYYRCSGIIADAIGLKTWIICPDFPMMKIQVTSPAIVGIVYKNEKELGKSLKDIIDFLQHPKALVFKEHYQKRSPKYIADLFDTKIQNKNCCGKQK